MNFRLRLIRIIEPLRQIGLVAALMLLTVAWLAMKLIAAPFRIGTRIRRRMVTAARRKVA